MKTHHCSTCRLPPALVILLLAGAVALSPGGCASQPVVYRDVPEWQLREGVVPERFVRPDGTLVINRPRDLGITRVEQEATEADVSGQPEDENGNVTLHALLPEQVLDHTLTCIADEEYELLWEQVLSRQTREQYARQGQTADDFSEFCSRNRDGLFASLNRMSVGMRTPAVIVETLPNGVTRVQFHRHYAKDFQFSTIDMVWEGTGMKLLMIHPTLQN